MAKRVKLLNYPQRPFIFVPETGVNKTIMVYGDSFAEAAREYESGKTHGYNNTINSWMWFLATFLQARVVSYGVSEGSEQLCYQLFMDTIDVPRDATIIYHTQENRVDKSGLLLPYLKRPDYVEWDKCTNNSTVHLYWVDSKPLYKFKLGASFNTKYHLSHSNDPNVFENIFEGKKIHFDELLKGRSANHVTQPGNLLLAIKLTQYFKEHLKWTAVF